MTHTLAIDVGSSSVKAAVLDGTDIVGRVASCVFETDRDGVKVEVPAERIDQAVREAVVQLDTTTCRRVGLTAMAPAWLAMDGAGNAITPIVTHQDRRSGREAAEIEQAIGRDGHLRLTGNRPTPGGISSTTTLWFARHSDVLQRAATVGHLPTYLMQKLTGRRVVDPSNAGFMGLLDLETSLGAAELAPPTNFERVQQRGASSAAPRDAVGGTSLRWSSRLTSLTHLRDDQLPSIIDAADVVGETRANDLNIPVGVPMFGGYVDGSGPLLVAGATPRQLIHSGGSTDVLAVCVEKPRARAGLLCRPLGTRGLWVLAATQAAGGAGLAWARQTLFRELDDAAFDAAVTEASERETSVAFRPHLAGDRQSVDQPTGGFEGLTLSTTRDDLLAAVVQALVADHRRRLNRLLAAAGEVDRRVITTGGGGVLPGLMRANWPEGDWAFGEVEQGTLRGLGAL